MMMMLLVFLCTSSVLAAETNSCVSPNITLEDKLLLNGNFNDHDNNSLVTSSDVAYDLNNNYDTNGDGAVSEEEWIARWTCAFGDTSYFARFAFNLVSLGEPLIKASQFTGPPFDKGLPRDQFIGANRERYTLFARKYGCVNTDLTIDQKLAINLEHNNHNNDSVVDSSDIAYDLDNNYDTDNDTKVTEAEWVVRWCCAYGDTAAYARYVWNQLSGGASFVQDSQFAGPPFDTGIPVHQFKLTNRKRYEAYAAEHQVPIGK